MNELNIRKLIDDAMEKKDRSVSILITENDIHVSVYPYSDEPLSWKNRKIGQELYTGVYECPSCGHCRIEATSYCPDCGEKLKLVTKEESE